MKKTIMMMLVSMLTLAGVTATAQKSSKYLVGTMSYSKSTDEDATYSFSPLVGYYVTNKTSVGVVAEVGESTDKTITNVGAFVRNDFMTIGKKCDIFHQLSVASKTSNEAGTKTSAFNITWGLGTNYIINSKWNLTMNLTDIITYNKVGGKSTFAIGFGNITNPLSAANIGLAYKF